MQVQISKTIFSPYALVESYQQQHIDLTQVGATTVFVGSMRDFNQGDAVLSMTLEYYPGMTEQALGVISDEAAIKWNILDSLVVHRVGDIQPGESIVLVVVWAAHRVAAYEANRYIMEALKSRAPFWKKEQLQASSRWVDSNTPG